MLGVYFSMINPHSDQILIILALKNFALLSRLNSCHSRGLVTASTSRRWHCPGLPDDGTDYDTPRWRWGGTGATDNVRCGRIALQDWGGIGVVGVVMNVSVLQHRRGDARGGGGRQVRRASAARADSHVAVVVCR